MRVLRSQFILLDILKTLKKHVWYCLTIQNKWRLSGNFWHNQEFFTIIKKFQDHPKNIQTIQKLSRLSRNFPRCPEIFRIIRKISCLSGNFLGYPETFQTIQEISRLSRNFPKGPESPHCNFRVYAQNLSERAKTFRMAMPPCYPGFWASGYHNARSRVNQSPS